MMDRMCNCNKKKLLEKNENEGQKVINLFMFYSIFFSIFQ